MTKNYVITARGKKLNLSVLKAARANTPVITNKPIIKNKKQEVTTINNVLPRKINAIYPSSLPVTPILPKINNIAVKKSHAEKDSVKHNSKRG
jgi:hypothetical protein